MRDWHYWKQAGVASAPQEIIVFDTETWHGNHARVDGGEYHRLRLGHAIAYRLERGRRTRIQTCSFVTANDFWALVQSRLNNRRTLWIFAHNAAYDLGIVGGWRRILGSEFECDQAILTQTMLLIRGKLDGCSVVFADTCNYYHCPLSSVGKAVGIPKMQMPVQEENDFVWLKYCRNDVEITAKGLDALIGFNRGNELGPWGPSIASLAYNAFRSKYMKHTVLVHCDWEDIKLERESYCGGITDCNYVGRVPFSPVHELDVNSMYGSMCLKKLPYRRISHSYKVGPDKLRATPSDQMVIARVTIEHDRERFPVKTSKGTIYPTGRYITTLAHPELMYALEIGAVKWVHHAVWYAAAPIFKEYMDYFGELKVKYHDADNQAFETLAKYFITNLYGKTGQTTPVWKRWGAEPLAEIERQYGYKPGSLDNRIHNPPIIRCKCKSRCLPRGNICQLCLLQVTGIEEEPWQDDLGGWHKVRDWFGFVEIKGGQYESRDSCPAIAACVTSYARVFLRQCHRLVGGRNWVYSDTDSIWVSDEGYRILSDNGYVRPGVFGFLDHKKAHEWMIVHGPKDYEVPGLTKLKGIKALSSDYVQDGDLVVPITIGEKQLVLIRTAEGEYRQTQFPSASVQIKSGMQDGIKVKHIKKRLARTIDRAKVLPDGWTRPLKFPGERP